MYYGYNFYHELELVYDKKGKEVKEYIFKIKTNNCHFVFNKYFTKGRFVYSKKDNIKGYKRLCKPVIEEIKDKCKRETFDLFHLAFKKEELKNLRIYCKTYDVTSEVKFQDEVIQTGEDLVIFFEIPNKTFASDFGSDLIHQFTTIDLDFYNDFQINNKYYKHFNIEYVSASPYYKNPKELKLTLGLKSEYFRYRLVKEPGVASWKLVYTDNHPADFKHNEEFLCLLSVMKEDLSRFLCNGRYIIGFDKRMLKDYECIIEAVRESSEYRTEPYHEIEYEGQKQELDRVVQSVLEEHPDWKEYKEKVEKGQIDLDTEECC